MIFKRKLTNAIYTTDFTHSLLDLGCCTDPLRLDTLLNAVS